MNNYAIEGNVEDVILAIFQNPIYKIGIGKNSKPKNFVCSTEELDVENNLRTYARIKPDYLSIYFRGENKLNTETHSGFYRQFYVKKYFKNKIIPKNSIKLIESLIKKNTFKEELLKHPYNNLSKRDQILLNLEDDHIPQHYGFKTKFLDITSSLGVAAFFATCYFDYNTQNWKTKKSGKGALFVFCPENHNDIFNITLDIFPRPRNQKAFSIYLDNFADFQNYSGVKKYTFKHDSKAGAELLKAFDNGKSIMPDDCIDTLARRIQNSKTFHNKTLLTVWEEYDNILSLKLKKYNSKILKKLKKNLYFVDDEIKFLEDDEIGVAKKFYAENKPKEINKARIRLIYNPGPESQKS